MRKTETKTVEVQKEVYAGTFCDVCGQNQEDATFNAMDRFEMGMNVGEEGEFLIRADICYDCAEGTVGKQIHAVMEALHVLIPGGSFRSSFGEWETTGEFLDG